MDNVSGVVGKFIAAVGFAIVAGAIAMLVAIWQTIDQLLKDPTQVPLVKLLMEKIGDSDKGLFGIVEGKPFEIHFGEPLRYMLYLILGTLALGLMVRVFSGLIHAGAGMIKMGVSMPSRPLAEGDKAPPP
jgi:H+/Cl- antiporter ClcA